MCIINVNAGGGGRGRVINTTKETPIALVSESLKRLRDLQSSISPATQSFNGEHSEQKTSFLTAFFNASGDNLES